MQIIYPDDCDLTRVPAIKRCIIHMINKNCTRAIIDFDEQKYIRGRRGHKEVYRENYSDELNKCFNENGVGLQTDQAVVCPKGNPPEGVGTTDFPSDKQIKYKYSALN